MASPFSSFLRLLGRGGRVNLDNGESPSSIGQIQRDELAQLAQTNAQANRDESSDAKELSVAAKEPLFSAKLQNVPNSQDQAGGVPGAEKIKQETKADLNTSIPDQPNQVARASAMEPPRFLPRGIPGDVLQPKKSPVEQFMATRAEVAPPLEPTSIGKPPPPTFAERVGQMMPPAPTTGLQPGESGPVQPTLSQNLMGQYRRDFGPPNLKQALLQAAVAFAPVAIAGATSGIYGAAGAAKGAEQALQQQQALREKQREELAKQIGTAQEREYQTGAATAAQQRNEAFLAAMEGLKSEDVRSLKQMELAAAAKQPRPIGAGGLYMGPGQAIIPPFVKPTAEHPMQHVFGEANGRPAAAVFDPNPDAKIRYLHPDGTPFPEFQPTEKKTGDDLDKYLADVEAAAKHKLTPAERVAATEKYKTLGPFATAAAQAPSREDTRMDRSYALNDKAVDVLEKPIMDQSVRLSRLRDTMNQMTPAADALIAPELITVMAGGAGSGVRITEPEQARTIGGRSNWESLKAALNKWSLDPTQALSITPAQRQQMRALMGVVFDKLQRKQQLVDDARQELINAPSVEAHRQVVATLKKNLNAVDTGTGGGGKQTIRVQIPGQRPGTIDADQWDAFHQRYPNAQQLQ